MYPGVNRGDIILNRYRVETSNPRNRHVVFSRGSSQTTCSPYLTYTHREGGGLSIRLRD